MSVEAEILPPEVSPIAIIDEALSNPESTLLDAAKRDLFLAKVREVSIIENPDVSTSKGREEIRTVAMKVTRAKTMLDKSRLGLTEEYRGKVAAINEAGKSVTTRLAAIAEEVRAPLTVWEDAEKAREAKVDEIIAYLKSASIVTISDTSNTIRSRGREVYNIEITKEFFGKSFAEAAALKESAVETLKAALTGLIEKEDQAAELQRLREAAAAREEQDRQEQAAREAVEAKRQFARSILEHIRQCTLGMIGGKAYPYVILIRELEEKIPAGEDELGDLAVEVENARVAALEHVRNAQQQQAEREEREAVEKARADAEAAVQAAAQREIDSANAKAAEAQRELEAEQKRAADEKAEQEQIAEAQRAEEARRERNRKHRREIHGQIKTDLFVAASITEEQATAIVKAMAAGAVRNVQVTY